MRLGLWVLLIACAAAVTGIGADVRPSPDRQVRLGRIASPGAIPGDLAQAEGKSRWLAAEAHTGATWLRSFTIGADGITVTDDGPAAESLVYADPAGGDAARRWLFPDQFPQLIRPGSRDTLEIEVTRGGRVDRLRIETQIVGIGWLELPSGPRETVLQRAFIMKQGAGRRGYAPDSFVHRFIDPRAGVVAEVEGPPSQDGRRRETLASATLVDAVILGAADLIIRTNEMWSLPHTDVMYGWDKGSATTTIASLVNAPGITNMGDVVALNTWDFSLNNSGSEVGFSTTTVSSTETCNYQRCGYDVPGAEMERTDINIQTGGDLKKNNDVISLETRAADDVIWVWGGAQREGRTGSGGDLASGEARYCYHTDSTGTRTPVPLFIFAHQEAGTGARYMQAGDSWTAGPFNCEQNTFNQVCGTGSLFPILYTKACVGGNGVSHTGTQSTTILKNGVVKLPSGHTFNAQLARVVADFCVYGTSGCAALFKFAEVRTVNYLWQVPNLGTVVRLQSDQNVVDFTSYTTVAETDIKFGLLPPRSISVTGSTGTSVSLSWDPGLDTHRINGYKIYWDTDSGGASPYGFNSVANAGQVAFAGTTATISGLTAGTTYSFTVTSLSNFTNPSTLVTQTYESLLYPTQVAGDPSFVYPVEVQGATTGGACIPTAEVPKTMTVTYDPLGVRICWDPVTDPCLVGYRVLSAASPQSAANFSVAADTGLTTCWSGNPAGSYFLVIARGTGGNGPWGHYGQ